MIEGESLLKPSLSYIGKIEKNSNKTASMKILLKAIDHLSIANKTTVIKTKRRLENMYKLCERLNIFFSC
tara:strand:- start:724 stop:933 length:210 start_codon:yes stop_codon:yes gene_type:complete